MNGFANYPAGYNGFNQQLPPMQTMQSYPPAHPQLEYYPQMANNQQPSRPFCGARTGQKGRHEYQLVVEQQPKRARMCGFGDKDRRPITSPPCIRLVITDIRSGKEVDYDDFESAFFILQVDLWDEKGEREVNIVRASSSTPAVSISTATMTSYPPPSERVAPQEQAVYYHANGQPYVGAAYNTGYPNPYAQQGYPPNNIPYASPPQQSSSMMFTRNLIGSLTVNASKLQDTNGKSGFWFVLQDLSVRTEGFFRLKMNFIDVGNAGAEGGLNKGRAPVLASVFSDKFQVYSAKKFPGVIESTPLSKCFANQGIKIPIRKDVKSEGKDDEDD